MRNPIFFCVIVATSLVSLAGCRDDGRTQDVDAGPLPDGGAQTPFTVETCPVPLEAPASGTCTVSTGTSDLIAIKGNILGDTKGYEHGTVLIRNQNIVCVGCDCSDQPDYDTATVIECANAAVSAALINPHEHMTFSEAAPIPTSERFDHRHDWRGSLSTPSNEHGTGKTSAGTRWVETRMLLSGVTSMVGSGEAEGMVRNLDRLSNQEASNGFRKVTFQTFSLGDANESQRENCNWNYRYDEDEVAGFDQFLPHVAEGINDRAAEEFFCQSRSTDGGEDFTEKNVAHIHSIGLTSEDYLRMAVDEAQIIWSPRSNISLYGQTAQVTTFAQFGGVIALGTDWSYSGSANMVRELACADQFNSRNLGGYFSAKQLHDMATKNAAIATGNAHLIGTLEPSKLADIAIYAGEPGAFHRSVIEANSSDVVLVIKDGAPMYGQTPLVEAFGTTCDPIDVCGESRSICVSREFGITYAELSSTVSQGSRPGYQAVFCEGLPPNEPTCTPSRPLEFNGNPTDNDADGDGLDNSADNCPTVFNPPRPMDNGAQPDSDGDGVGDACDDTPLPLDLDNDGLENAADNCPFDPNSDQSDGDTDTKGDVCDICPAVPNPDTGCAGGVAAIDTTVVMIQNETVPADTVVKVSDIVVTGVSNNGFVAQDPNVADGHYAGIFVFTGSEPAVSIGDVVDVTGETSEFFGNTQISASQVTPKGSTGTINATPVTVAEAASEPYENVLVQITAGTFSDNYDCSQDDSNCSDANLWAYTDANATTIIYDRFYGGTMWVSHKDTLPVTGITMFRFNGWRLMPRSDADFGS